jgi:hypothetical protein
MSIVPNESQENHLLRAALGYAGRGWPVMPLHWIADGKCSCRKKGCDSAGKHPRTRHGLKDATVNEEAIMRWWAQWPMANVGIATGQESGFFMIGPDGQAGIEALAELERTHGPLPPTPRLRSGGGGRHYYLAWPADGGIRTGANYNGLPLDVRAIGGLVVAPPSLHLSGCRYAWEVPPEVVQPAPAPDWLLDWLRKGQGTNKAGRKKGGGKVIFTVQPDRGTDVRSRAVTYLERCPPAVSGQGGHSRTFEVARAVVYGFDLGPEAGFDLLWQHYNPQCVPPWSEAELRHKCRDADAKPFDKPRGYLIGEDQRPAPPGPVPPAGGAPAEDIEGMPMPQPAPWPTLPAEAFHGLAGEVVQTLAPETEADPVAILGQLLVAFGNTVGRGPHFPIEGDSHHTNLFLCLVGESSRGRKGTSRGRVMQLMRSADAAWCEKCVASGLSSGEGLIWAVRDPIERREPVKQKGRVTGYQMVVVDEGVSDKRLLADESEFAQVLKVLQREGNSLSPVIRQSWDTGNLRTLTKNTPARATGGHVSISAHVTRAELVKHLRDTEALNGFANRFLWVCVRRARLLPDGGRALDLSPFGTRLNYALAAARNVTSMTRSEAAGRLWHEAYPQLTAERPGLYGAVTGRAEAQVLRVSMVYALLDGVGIIDEPHFRAALALWSYADTSARLTFGAEPEDPLAGLVLAKLREAGPAGMTRTELHNAFSRNVPAANLLEALAKLRDRGEAFCEKVKTGRPGAPAERWYARRTNEENESTTAGAADRLADGVDSFNSSLRRPSPNGPPDGEEVVIV